MNQFQQKIIFQRMLLLEEQRRVIVRRAPSIGIIQNGAGMQLQLFHPLHQKEYFVSIETAEIPIFHQML